VVSSGALDTPKQQGCYVSASEETQKRPAHRVRGKKALCVSLLDLYISSREIRISVSEICKSFADLCISLKEIHISLFDLYISSREICIFLLPTTQPSMAVHPVRTWLAMSAAKYYAPMRRLFAGSQALAGGRYVMWGSFLRLALGADH